MNYLEPNNFLPGPFPLVLPNELKYGKLLPDFLSIEERAIHHENLKTQPADWPYRTKEVKYKLNLNYYRAPEWDTIDWKECIAVFGCSHVFGEGLAETETLCHHLSKLTGRQVINLGQSGTSPMFSWHNSLLLDKWYPTPYAVVQVWSDIGRFLYYEENKVSRVGYWSGGRWDNYDKRLKSLFEIWNGNDTNPKTQMYFTGLACEGFWKTRTRYVQVSFFEETAKVLGIHQLYKLDCARDLIHYGTLSHRTAAQIIESNLK